jgi:hypothetical protein
VPSYEYSSISYTKQKKSGLIFCRKRCLIQVKEKEEEKWNVNKSSNKKAGRKMFSCQIKKQEEEEKDGSSKIKYSL